MARAQRFVDEVVEAFDLNQRRKYELKAPGKSWTLYFRPITRADRKLAQNYCSTNEALDISTQMLCQIAELEDGSKAFDPADTAKLQHMLPESVLNELELFLFGLGDAPSLEEAKND